MRVTSVRRAIIVAVIALGLTWLLVVTLGRWRTVLPPVSAYVGLVEVALAVVVLLMGMRVRRFLAGKNPQLRPLVAVRAFVLAKAASYCGSILVGWYGAQALDSIKYLQLGAGAPPLVSALVAVAGAMLLASMGLVVERWCRIPPPKDEDKVPGSVPDPA